MSEMVERVAKVIFERELTDNPDRYSWEEMGPGRNIYRETARAAIEAMREPTEAMKRSGKEWIGSYGPIMTWEAMIDEALKDA